MFSNLAMGVEAVAVILAAMVVAWAARRAIRWATRRAVRRARRERSSWRIRLDRLGDDGHGAARRLQRADAVARIFGPLITVFIVAVAVLIALDLIGINPVYAVSSAGFLGFALALSGQDLIKDLIGGTRALLEDRYAVGDEVGDEVGDAVGFAVGDTVGCREGAAVGSDVGDDVGDVALEQLAEQAQIKAYEASAAAIAATISAKVAEKGDRMPDGMVPIVQEFMRTYLDVVAKQKRDPMEKVPVLKEYLGLVEDQLDEPFVFAPYHEAWTEENGAPIDHLKMDTAFMEPMFGYGVCFTKECRVDGVGGRAGRGWSLVLQ